MTRYFLDSSALVKRYVPEPGTAQIRAITVPSAGDTILIAHITSAEIVSAAVRRAREGSIPARVARAIRLLVDRHASREYRVIGLTGRVIQRAEDLLELYPLRVYDSMQLASAIESNGPLVAAGLPPLTFVSADTRLLPIAEAMGLVAVNPGQQT